MNEKLDDFERRFERLTADLSNSAMIAIRPGCAPLDREAGRDVPRPQEAMVELRGNEGLLGSSDAEMKALALRSQR